SGKAPPPPPPDSLAILYSYKNNRYGTHAYCATDACAATVRGRGFTASKEPAWKLIALNDAALAKAKKECPGVVFKPLGFPKRRQGYTHNLEGSGLLAGYVPLEHKCGATKGVRAFNQMFGD
ncbi:hypothetical protein PENTCL1PPCAC_8081, partial [Pristionchus entomophagus]